MSKKQTKTKNYQIRAIIPSIVRWGAAFGLIVTVLAIVIGFFFNSKKEEFRLKPQHAQLSKDVIGIINGYERKETDNGVLKYYIKADKATTFSDNHQELENVYLQVFDEENQDVSDKISSNKAIYIPASDKSKNFTIYFAGDVDLKTRNDLRVLTEQLSYDKSTEIADSEVLVEFQRENISGKSFGALVNVRNKTLDLQKDVEINAYASDNEVSLTLEGVQKAKLIAGRAHLDQAKESIKLENGVFINLTPELEKNGEINQPTDIKANSANAFFKNKEIRKIDLEGNVDVYQKPSNNNASWTKTKANRAVAEIDKELKNITLFDNVFIETSSYNSKPTTIRTSKAIYDKDLDRFDLENNVEIITDKDSQLTKITANNAIYEQTIGKVILNGNAQIIQNSDIIKGEVINAELFPNKQVKYAFASGDAYLKQDNANRQTEVFANELNASFYNNQKIQKANAVGKSKIDIKPVNSSEYTNIVMSAPKEINLDFRNDGTLSNLQTQGRTTIKLNSPNNSPDSANKSLTADKINSEFSKNGNELIKAVATGDAELSIDPIRSSPNNYKTTINAPHFECSFYSKNNAKECFAKGNATAIRNPTVSGKNKQFIKAISLKATFNQRTQDLERFDAVGKAKFSEGDRNGIANIITYTADDQFVRLRGEEPTVWDSNARAKADQIDWDTQGNKSSLNGKVSTTYFSQKKTGGATPFAGVSSPVFITSSNVQFDHSAETALFTGNARAWQENNYVRAEKLFLQQKQGQLFAEGKVQSVLYDTSRTVSGRTSKIPVFASSDKMNYKQENNKIQYEDNVDIRQGNDRIVAGIANVYLDNRNQLRETIVENNVVITQPNRRASGTYASYNAGNESVILRGNPAQVTDSLNGSTAGKEILVNLKENRVISKSKNSPNSTGRNRTVYKIKNGKIN